MTGSAASRTKHDRLERPRLAYSLLQELAESGDSVTDAEVAKKLNWAEGTVKSYRGKKWRDWIEKCSPKTWSVLPAFKGVTEEAFLRHQTQRTDYYARYQTRNIYHVTAYEFLIPLTKEHELKKALDDLFYLDALEERIREVGPDSFGILGTDNSPLTEAEKVEVIIDFVADRFTGYSVAHVSGRFRSVALADRVRAGDMFAKGQPYLVDETTAVVRFIVPLHQSSHAYGNGDEFLGAVAKSEESSLSQEVRSELAQVRRAFFLLFTEAVVRTVKGEDQVWLLESGPENRLYVWEKT